MPSTPALNLDPDRFLNFGTPGSQEWWYFDAISDDGRDAIVAVWYAGLPFDPSYGVAAIKHGQDPRRHPAPHPLDHCAIGLSWYRDGKTVAYALNAFRRDAFAHDADPFGIEVQENRLTRSVHGYTLRVRTPAVDGRRRIEADLTFRPFAGTEPVERDLGHDGSPHLWILAAPDCRVSGTVALEGKGGTSLDFRGRGYHDHNAGAEEISMAMRRWAWGRFHQGPRTHVYYHAESHGGARSGLWITLRDGRSEAVRDDAQFLGDEPGFASHGRAGNVFGLRHGKALRVSDGTLGFLDERTGCVDDGPFYRRWVTTLGTWLGDEPNALGISEWLDTRNLNRPLFNWMIPYRLKRPAG